ncbi:unnamed protein product [Paramecium sonneborni]|uniref:Uncharacterized protein n=1 Tax=Paramecium sonneborni TaxID=65129 RepID=A0A8S1KTV4_9CILI|nr:unnamed protein product [Paramecium sonneborni]
MTSSNSKKKDIFRGTYLMRFLEMIRMNNYAEISFSIVTDLMNHIYQQKITLQQ